MIHVLSNTPSAANEYIAELRDCKVQTDRMRFRDNLRRLGVALGLELSKRLKYAPQWVETPLGQCRVERMHEQPVLATILRAGLPLHEGLASVFDRADQAFVTACRRYSDADHSSFEIAIEALSSPSLTGRILILADPMLATGASLVQVANAMIQSHGTPSEIHVVAAIASEQGIQAVASALPAGSHLWVGAVDPELSDRGYILPGLGDAGDLAFGPKM